MRGKAHIVMHNGNRGTRVDGGSNLVKAVDQPRALFLGALGLGCVLSLWPLARADGRRALHTRGCRGIGGLGHLHIGLFVRIGFMREHQIEEEREERADAIGGVEEEQNRRAERGGTVVVLEAAIAGGTKRREAIGLSLLRNGPGHRRGVDGVADQGAIVRAEAKVERDSRRGVRVGPDARRRRIGDRRRRKGLADVIQRPEADLVLQINAVESGGGARGWVEKVGLDGNAEAGLRGSCTDQKVVLSRR